MALTQLLLFLVIGIFIGCTENSGTYEMRESGGKIFRLNKQTGEVCLVVGDSLYKLEQGCFDSAISHAEIIEEIIKRRIKKDSIDPSQADSALPPVKTTRSLHADKKRTEGPKYDTPDTTMSEQDEKYIEQMLELRKKRTEETDKGVLGKTPDQIILKTGSK